MVSFVPEDTILAENVLVFNLNSKIFGSQRRSGHTGEEKNLLHLTGMEQLFRVSPTRYLDSRLSDTTVNQRNAPFLNYFNFFMFSTFFRTPGFTFRKTVVSTIMVWCVLQASVGRIVC